LQCDVFFVAFQLNFAKVVSVASSDGFVVARCSSTIEAIFRAHHNSNRH